MITRSPRYLLRKLRDLIPKSEMSLLAAPTLKWDLKQKYMQRMIQLIVQKGQLMNPLLILLE